MIYGMIIMIFFMFGFIIGYGIGRKSKTVIMKNISAKGDVSPGNITKEN